MAKKEKTTSKEKLRETMENRPVRPRHLRSQVLRLYALLALAVVIFYAGALTLKRSIPEGKYLKKNNELIDIMDFDPVEMGPFPKCHPHFGEHQGKDGWVKNDAIVADPKSTEEIIFPIGHPENKEWIAKREAFMKASNLDFKSLQPSIHMLILAVVVTYLGCYHAVWLYAKPDPKLDPEDTERDEDVNQSAIEDGDAYYFPIVGSAVLFGLFIVFKYLNSEWIKFLFNAYVVLMCVNGLGINIGQIVAVLVNSRGLGRFKTLFHIPFADVPVTWIDIAAYAASVPLGIFYMQSKNWVLNNIMGLSFCVMGIKHIGISSYKTGAIMLLGLFFYDVFWVFGSKSVFGSNVMVTVATSVEAPIKLMLPRDIDGCGNLVFSMLGLGDIVVPGIFVALLAKWDLKRPDANHTFVYLHWTMLFYTLSLVTTVVIMLVFNHAQPALLYIVPYVLIASMSVCAVKRQVSSMFGFIVEDTMIAVESDTDSNDKTKKDN